jgi:hypothetical protein
MSKTFTTFLALGGRVKATSVLGGYHDNIIGG